MPFGVTTLKILKIEDVYYISVFDQLALRILQSSLPFVEVQSMSEIPASASDRVLQFYWIMVENTLPANRFLGLCFSDAVFPVENPIIIENINR